MNKNYIPTFGVEIHAELLTKSKAFSPARVTINDIPNKNINPIDLAHPGMKPLPNKMMVNFTYRLAKALQMTIADVILFDRKNYFYPDLPKGYQITQFYFPIGRDGIFTITKENGSTKDIKITEIHMEEDTAKQIKKGGRTFLDFNRAGIPLIEIVSGHKEFVSIEEVLLYVKQLRYQLLQLEINDGKLFEGSFRIDVNLSIRKKDQKEYGTRVEIKNLNSFSNIRKALNWEIEHQINLLENNKKVRMVTKRYDENKDKNISMRFKQSTLEYNYFPEQNINPIKLDQKTLKEFNAYKIMKIADFYDEYNQNIEMKVLDLLLESKDITNFFINLIQKKEKNQVINFITSTLFGVINEINEETFNINEDDLEKILELLVDNKITKSEANDLINDSLLNINIDNEIIAHFKKEMVDSAHILKLVKIIFEKNENLTVELISRPERVNKFIMGQLMKQSKGKINPKKANELIVQFIKDKQNEQN